MTEEHSPSLREALAAAWDAPAAEAETPAAEPAPAAEGPARDENGRFKAKEAEPAAEAEAAPEPAATEPEPDDYDETTGFERDLWAQLPAPARAKAKEIAEARRQAEERARAFESLERVLASRRDALRATYGGEDRALEQLFHLSDWATRDPAGFARHFIEQRGIDPRTLAPQQAEPGQTAPQPDIETILSQRVEQALAQRETARALQEFEGNTALEFRHDPDIRRAMAGLIQAGAAHDYATAYEMATKAHPQISAKLAERARAEQAKREREEAARRASAAASAAVSVRGAPGTARPPAAAAPASIRDALIAGWEAEAGRV